MLKKIVLGAMALAMAQAASAQQFYGLGSIGISEFTGGDADNICRSVQECDRTGNAFKLIGGYKLTPSLAVEGGYWNYGRLTGRRNGTTTELEASAFGAGLAYHHPFSTQWQGVARLGLSAMDAKLSINGATAVQESSAQFYGGLSLGYVLAPNIALDGGWDFSFGSVNGSNFDINAVSLGLRVGF
ncbi:MAG TPA: outer membrane beta-barrel protein [Burkholderiaceae bacterium]|nr:outer membrane beta-barrel protein [Burkholderiaceae bacterium]